MKSIVLAALGAAWLAVSCNSAHAAACDGFVDVDDANVTYCPAVTYMKSTGITLGCDATHYCPNDPVTRLQMALFIQRMANKAVFRQGGNAFGAQAVIGTTDAQSLKVIVGNTTLWRAYLIGVEGGSGTSIVGGHDSNVLGPGAYSSVIGGGGSGASNCGIAANEPCNHQIDAEFGVIGGGLHNHVTNPHGTVGGGKNNTAASISVVAGGSGNRALGSGQTIAGGLQNYVDPTAPYATVGGGTSNGASATYATVGGGLANQVSGVGATVSGGQDNSVLADNGVVAGGLSNSVDAQFGAVGGGAGNQVGGNGATVPGGLSNSADGAYSVVLGSHGYTTAAATGSFIFSDSTLPGTPFGTDSPNQFVVAATGGIGMVTSKTLPTGCGISAGGGSWACSSSRAVKRDFTDVDPQDILDKVAALPVMRWRYGGEDASIRHLGTFAEDFHAAFGLGDSDKSITMADADGVAMAAIQGLYARALRAEAMVGARDAQVANLGTRLDERDAVIADLVARMSRLETQLAH